MNPTAAIVPRTPDEAPDPLAGVAPATPAPVPAPEPSGDLALDLAAIQASLTAELPAAPTGLDAVDPLADPAPAPEPLPDPAPVEPQPEPTEPEPVADPVTGVKPPQFRIRPSNEVDQLALSYIAAAQAEKRPLAMEEALRRAKVDLGIVQSDGTPAPVEPPPTPSSEIQRQIEALEEERDAAVLVVNTPEQVRIEKEIRKLEREALPVAKAYERAAQRAESQQVATAWEGNLQQAMAQYPALADTSSPFAVRAAEIDAFLLHNNPDLYNSPTKATLIANKVAAELGVLPEVPGSRPKAAPAAPAATTPSRQTPTPPKATSLPLPVPPTASGNQSASSAPSAALTELASVSNEWEMADWMARNFGRR